ncbi:ankyrin repeat domain-containing protein 26-like [Notamacropus eugenii]|uniref:ankyrin repeat domain-containing protein 26-like n=1 Tax=Notamacropus eugenii TaxID=9315 RepID=UPI003B67EAEC
MVSIPICEDFKLRLDEEELKETQGPLFPQLNVIALQSGILNNPLSKHQENKTTASKITQTFEIPDSHEKEKYLFQKNQILEDENAMLKLEVDTQKIKDQDKENHIEILKEKNDHLQQELKLNTEALRTIRVQYSEEVKVVTAENAGLNSKLETAKENTDRLEGEIESYRSRLMSVIDDYEQSEASKLALEHSFQEARDEWLHVQDKLNSDLSILRETHAFLSEELSQAESGAKSLENELGHVHECLREKTYTLENTQTELNHAEETAKELEETNQVLKEKFNRYSLENESLQERLGQIQSENMVLQQALEDTQKKVTMKEKQLSDAQVQFIDLFNKLYADSEQQVLLVEESKKVLVSECNHLGEEMCKYEIEKAERGFGH